MTADANPCRPVVTVVIPSWNTAAATLECLRSLESERPEPSFEVVLVDNASPDGTADRVRREHPEVTVVEHARNRGFAAACNAGWRVSRGRLVLFLNSDTTLGPGALANLVAAMDAESDVGLLGPRLTGRSGALQPSVRSDPTPGALLHQHTILRHARFLAGCESRYKMRSFGFDRRSDVPVLMGAALLARREAIEAAGPFDEGYFMYFEEADLCRRVRASGWRVVFDPAPTIRHSGGESRRRAGAEIEVAYVRSLLRYVARWEGDHRGRLFAALFLPAWWLRRMDRALRDAIGLVFATATGRAEAALRCERSLVQGLDLLTRRLFEVVRGATRS